MYQCLALVNRSLLPLLNSHHYHATPTNITSTHLHHPNNLALDLIQDSEQLSEAYPQSGDTRVAGQHPPFVSRAQSHYISIIIVMSELSTPPPPSPPPPSPSHHLHHILTTPIIVFQWFFFFWGGGGKRVSRHPPPLRDHPFPLTLNVYQGHPLL